VIKKYKNILVRNINEKDKIVIMKESKIFSKSMDSIFFMRLLLKQDKIYKKYLKHFK